MTPVLPFDSILLLVVRPLQYAPARPLILAKPHLLTTFTAGGDARARLRLFAGYSARSFLSRTADRIGFAPIFATPLATVFPSLVAVTFPLLVCLLDGIPWIAITVAWPGWELMRVALVVDEGEAHPVAGGGGDEDGYGGMKEEDKGSLATNRSSVSSVPAYILLRLSSEPVLGCAQRPP